MKKHVKIYLDYHDFGLQDVILCEVCNSKANDIHHITFKSQGGKDVIENLIALCRKCHEKAHESKEFNQKLKDAKEIEFSF